MKKSELLHQSIETIEEAMKKLEKVAEKDDSDWELWADVAMLLIDVQGYWVSAKDLLSRMASLWEREELRREQKKKEETVTQETSPSPTEKDEASEHLEKITRECLVGKTLRLQAYGKKYRYEYRIANIYLFTPKDKRPYFYILLEGADDVRVTLSEMQGLRVFGSCETDDGQRFTIVKETPENTQETSPTAISSEAVVGAENAQTTSGYLGKVVRVEWQDHYSLRGWWPMKDLDTEPVRCVSIGRVIIETDQILMVAGTIGHESENNEEKASDPIAIIKGEITSITEIQGVTL